MPGLKRRKRRLKTKPKKGTQAARRIGRVAGALKKTKKMGRYKGKK